MLLSYQNHHPRLAEQVFVEETARVIGDVQVGRQSSIWFYVVVRGDVNHIRIGERTNIQDGSVVHVTHDTHPTHIGHGVTVGHHVTLHGCTVEDFVLVGIGARVLDGACIGSEAMVAAGSVVAPGTQIPAGTLARGIPAKPVRNLTPAEIQHLHTSADNYVGYATHWLGSS